MPFVRCTRDKRGYEHIYLMHAPGRRGKPSKPRLLYWFRTPPGVKVGREPFDETVRRTIEAQNPGVAFDWKKLSVIPQAPVDVEYWRERRRNERAAKQARRAEQAVDATETEANEAADATEAEATDDALATGEVEGEMSEAAEGIEAASSETSINEEIDDEPAADDAPAIATSAATPATSPPGQRRRRRRGGRRRRRKHHEPAQAGQAIQDTEARAVAPAESTETPNAVDTTSKNE